MSNILKKISGWFGESQSAPKNSVLPSSHNAQHSVLHDGSETATRGQLVQVLLKDLLRKSAIPSSWVQCQIQVINSRSRGQGIYVRLVVKQWDERLMKYAFAFQKTLLTDIIRFEPKAADWLQGISWQLEVAASCPLGELPSPEYWQDPAPVAAPANLAKPVDPFDIIPLPANAAGVSAGAAVAAAEVVAVITAPVLPTIPPPTFLLDEIAPQLPDDTAQDLEQLFAIRDNELANLAANDLLPPGYESTEPSPLLRH